MQVDIARTRCALVGSNVATDLQIDCPPRLSLVASTATPCPCTCPIMDTILPGTLTFQSQCVSENPAGIEYSESRQLSISSHTGRTRFTESDDGRCLKVTFSKTSLVVAE